MFNLSSLTGNTVSYFISDQTPSPVAPGDSAANLASQIQAAAAVWNTVPSSSIRVAFGGFAAIGAPQTAPQSTPGIDVIFNDADVPPGLLAQTRLTWLTSDVNAVSNGAPFVPIRRSTIALRHNLLNASNVTNSSPLASYDDLFFMVMVHEFGHALGLQHTLTSGVMATNYTAATTKAAPLSPDDVAGISLLYPTQNYTQGVGAISGAVQVAGKGVNLANVVALSASGTAISTLTAPDGTFQIQGVPAGQYYLYASPLPPAQNGEAYPDNIVPPEDALGNPFNADTGFDTEFSPGTRDLTQAAVVTVGAGVVSGGVNCNLQPRSGPAVTYVETWGYVGQIAVASPPLLTGSRQYLVFGGPTGITSSGNVAAGLSVSAIGAATVEPKTLAYNSPGYAEVVVDPGPLPAASSQASPVPLSSQVALVVTLPNDMYVLPYAFSVVPAPPPSITGVSGVTDGLGNTTVNLAGSNLNASTTILFDGAPAQVQAVNSDGIADGRRSPRRRRLYRRYSRRSQMSARPPAISGHGLAAQLYLLGCPESVDYRELRLAVARGDFHAGHHRNQYPVPVRAGFHRAGIERYHLGQIWVWSSGRVLANVKVSPQAQPGPVDVTAYLRPGDPDHTRRTFKCNPPVPIR